MRARMPGHGSCFALPYDTPRISGPGKDKARAMANTPSSKFLDRSAIRRILEFTDKVDQALCDVPYRLAVPALDAVQSIRNIVTADLPGGYIGLFKSCREMITGDENFTIGDGFFLCANCAKGKLVHLRDFRRESATCGNSSFVPSSMRGRRVLRATASETFWICDPGPGFKPLDIGAISDGLGLPGLRERKSRRVF